MVIVKTIPTQIHPIPLLPSSPLKHMRCHYIVILYLYYDIIILLQDDRTPPSHRQDQGETGTGQGCACLPAPALPFGAEEDLPFPGTLLPCCRLT